MDEKHENEQRFFDASTVAHLADLAGSRRAPCCLCVPGLGEQLAARGVAVRVLDIDTRFAHLPGFRAWDLTRPEWLGEAFDLILCDPPFFNVSFRQLFDALHLLARYDTSQPLAISYLTRREGALLARFEPFGLRPTGFYPGYRSVVNAGKNEIQFYANFPFPGVTP